MDTIRPLKELDSIVLYDGVCKFCNNSVNFILEYEKTDALKFVPLQSSLGAQILRQYGFSEGYTDSILFLNNNMLYAKSSAVLRISKFLKVPWNLFAVFLIVPGFILDVFYDLIAKNRYNWFGRTDACILPPTNYKLRFLE